MRYQTILLAAAVGLLAFETGATARWISDRADGGVDVARPMVGVGVAATLPKDVIAVRKRFVLKDAPASAHAKVTGLGFYRLVVNGVDVDPTRMMMPGWTNPGWRVLYDEYDVARWLREGTNEVRILLAPGYADDMNPWTWRWMRPKRAWMEMEVADGDAPRRIVTDGTWEFTDDLPFVSASIYHGETYDATRGGNARWRPVVELADDSLRLELNEGPAVRLFDPIRPVKVIRCPYGRLILDFGVNRAGVVELRAKLPRGARVILRHAEEILGDRLDTRTQKEARQTDVFIAAGTGEAETYRPRFTYHGFRYVEVEGLPADQAKAENFTGWGVSADVREKATFRCSDETLNWLWDTARRSMRSNFVSYPSDCCIRHERTPCLMDSQAYEDTAFQVYDIRTFYSKWLYDAARYERAVDPRIGNNDNPDWASDPITLSGRFLTYLAATNLAVREYAELKRAAESFAARSPDGLWEKGFGDWCSPAGWDFFDPALVNSAFLAEAYRAMAHLAEVKGARADAARFADLRRKAHAAFLRKHYDPKTHVFGAGRQVCYILPLALGLVPEGDVPAVVANLRQRLVGTDGGHIGTGIYGTRYFGDVLMDHGLGDEWLTAMTRKDFPGFGFMRASGATSLWEQWTRDGEMNSHNHAMFAGAVSCFFTHLAGIRPAADGYSRVLVKPCFPKGLDSVEATIELPCGRFAVSWRRRGKDVDYRLSAPEDARIEFDLPQGCNLIREVEAGLVNRSGVPRHCRLKSADVSSEGEISARTWSAVR